MAATILFVAIFAPVLVQGAISVTIDGRQISFDDQQPAVVDGRTLVPVRGVFEALGFDVEWHDIGRGRVVLSRQGDTVALSIDSQRFETNDRSLLLTVPAQIIGGRTMLPIRAMVESVGYYVEWDADTQTVIISSEPVRLAGEGGFVWAVPPTLAYEQIFMVWGMFFIEGNREIDPETGLLTGEILDFNGCGDPPSQVVDPVLGIFGDPIDSVTGLHGGIGLHPLAKMSEKFPNTIGNYFIAERVDSTRREYYTWDCLCCGGGTGWWLVENARFGDFAIVADGRILTDFVFENAVAIDTTRAFARYNGKYGILDMRATAVGR
jgi:hypothetical protein